MNEMDSIDNVIPSTDVVKCTPRIGAEIRNIKLSADLPDQTIATINGLLLEHKVIFFRDQDHLDDAEQERFALRFGSLRHIPREQGRSSRLIPHVETFRRTFGTSIGPAWMPIPKFRYCEAF